MVYRSLGTAFLSFCLILVVSIMAWMTWRAAPQGSAALAVSTSAASAVASTAIGTPTTLPTGPTPVRTPYDVLQQEPHARATAYAVHCNPRRSSPIWPRDVCSELKYHVLVIEDAQAAASATAAAPTQDPLRTATPQPPLPTSTPYILSATDLVIRPIDLSTRGGRDPHSLWSLGTVVGSRGEPYAVKLWGTSSTRNGPTVSVIGIDYEPMPDQPFESDPAMADQRWVSPRAIGAITITAVSGQKGIVSFEGEHGETGTFDLTSEQWTFDNAQTPVAQTAVATAQPATVP